MTITRVRSAAAALALGSLVLAGAAASTAAGAAVPPPANDPDSEPAMEMRVQEVMANLDHPWDVAFTPDGTMLVTERDQERILARLPNGNERVLAENPPGVWHGGETGLMGLVVDPDFDVNRFFYTCHGSDAASAVDIRVVRWVVDATFTTALQVEPIVTGIPVTTGRNGGCRLRFGPNGALYVGTGDAAEGTNPQDLTSLGGKVLRVDPVTGGPEPGNPFEDASNANTRLIWTYGHRNVQGLAYRGTTGVDPGMWAVERGPDRDDEVNELEKGGNSGWNPVPGYDESVPMTDFSLGRDVFGAKWSSGAPTLGTSGATWLNHRRWGNWKSRLAVTTLDDTSLQIMRFGPAGGLVSILSVPELDYFGRLRTAQLGPKGALYITTDNGNSNDRVLRVTVRE